MDKKELGIGVLIIVLMLTCFFWIIFPLAAPLMFSKFMPEIINCEVGENCLDIAKLGQFGDMFGAINALFSAMAFGGLIYTVFLQKAELALQREELSETRKEIKGQREQLQAQNETMQKQTFENRFFQLLTIHQNNIQGIDIRSDGKIIRQGRDCFESFYKTLKTNYNGRYKTYDSFLGAIKEDLRNSVADIVSSDSYLELQSYRNLMIPKYLTLVYEINYINRQSDLGHYFRTVYHIFKFIKESAVSDRDKHFYASLMRAQLSTYEQMLLFYNCLSPHGFEKFWPIANEFSLFQNIEMTLILSPEHLDFYSKMAYE